MVLILICVGKEIMKHLKETEKRVWTISTFSLRSILMLYLGAKLTESSGLLSKVTKLVGKGNKDSSEQQADEKKDKEKEKGRSNLKHTKDDFVISGPTSKDKNTK
jgi:hypothetical protein